MAAPHRAERDDIAVDPRHAADEGVPTDAPALLHRRMAAQDHILAQVDVAAERDVVGHHHMVADVAVMAYVRADVELAVAADAGDAMSDDRAAMHGDVLADDVAGADDEPARI